jgi:hypothetical protein
MTRRDFKRIDFAFVADQAARNAPSILAHWLPDGKRIGREWCALNPTRADHHLGSLKINLVTTRWSDFSTSARGGDLVSLASYLFGLSQRDAAIRVAEMVGCDPYER